MKKVTVLGMGYIGFPTGLLLADAGFEVYGFDIDKKRITILKNGKLPFEEHGLKELFQKVKSKKSFSPVKKIEPADVFIIAVPTPLSKDNKADLSYIFSALEKIKTVFQDGNLIILESTVGPLDCDKKIIPRIAKFGKKFHFAHVPEKAIPGNTLYEMVQNDRVIGGLTKKALESASKVYSSFVKGQLIFTTPKIAAVSKIMENAFRDVNIALANEFTKVAEELGFDVWEAIKIANYHPRVNIHQPGPGVGGHCIPIDPWFLVGESTRTKLIPLARSINDGMSDYICNKINNLIKKYKIENAVIGILGYAYKKNVGDFRQTPAENLVKLLEDKYKIMINDPFVTTSSREMIDLEKVLNKTDVIILVTDHDIYQQINFSRYHNIKLVFDSRNLFNKNNFKKSKIKLYKLGGSKCEDFDSD